MARVNILALVDRISKESISHPDVNAVHVTPGDVAKPVKEDTDQRETDEGVSAAVTDTKTTQPGPKDGGGDGTADFQQANKATTNMDVADVNANLERDQNGGRHIDTLPNKVKPKDGLSGSDVSTSVESHDDESSAEQADLNTVETGGAETVGEADDMVMDIDEEAEAVNVLSQTEIESKVQGQILSEIGELETAKAAVESYLHVLTSMERRGVEMSNEVRAVMAAGLKSISVEMFSPEIVTLENFRVSNEANDLVVAGRREEGYGEFVDDDDTEFDGARDKAKKGLTGKLKQLWEAIKRAWHRAMSALADVWNSFTQDTGKLEEHLRDLKKRSRGLEGGKPMKIANSTRLMMGDEFVGDSPEAIKRVTAIGTELLMTWPSSLVKLMDAIEKGTGIFSSGNTAEILDTFDDAVNGAFRSLKELSSGDRELVPSGFLDSESIVWSGPLPGNRALYVGKKRSKQSGVMGSIDDMNKINSETVNINFSAMPNEATHTGEANISSISGSDAGRVISELEKMISHIKGRREGIDKLRKKASDLDRKTSSEVWIKGLSDDSVIAFMAAQSVARATASSEHAFIGYMLSMIKAYIGFIEGSIKLEEGKQGQTIDA